jgi:hypothetical protein
MIKNDESLPEFLFETDYIPRATIGPGDASFICQKQGLSVDLFAVI